MGLRVGGVCLVCGAVIELVVAPATERMSAVSRHVMMGDQRAPVASAVKRVVKFIFDV